jgi:hypothetical protein
MLLLLLPVKLLLLLLAEVLSLLLRLHLPAWMLVLLQLLLGMLLNTTFIAKPFYQVSILTQRKCLLQNLRPKILVIQSF